MSGYFSADVALTGRHARFSAAVGELSYESGLSVEARLGAVGELVRLADEWLADVSVSEGACHREAQDIVSALCAYVSTPFPLASRAELYGEVPPNLDQQETLQFHRDKKALTEESRVRVRILEEIHTRVRWKPAGGATKKKESQQVAAPGPGRGSTSSFSTLPRFRLPSSSSRSISPAHTGGRGCTAPVRSLRSPSRSATRSTVGTSHSSAPTVRASQTSAAAPTPPTPTSGSPGTCLPSRSASASTGARRTLTRTSTGNAPISPAQPSAKKRYSPTRCTAPKPFSATPYFLPQQTSVILCWRGHHRRLKNAFLRWVKSPHAASLSAPRQGR